MVNAYDRVNYISSNLPTLQEMMIAPAYLTERHDAAQENLDQLLTEAQKVELAAMESPNGTAYNNYMDYTRNLQQAVKNLSEYGYNGSNIRSSFGKLRADYQAKIAPIAQAWAQQKQDKDTYNLLRAKDHSLLSNYDPSQTSIDAYLSRNNASYMPDTISGNELTKMAAEAAKPYAQVISQTMPELIKNPELAFKYFSKLQRGATTDDLAQVAEMIKADSNNQVDLSQASQIARGLYNIVNNTMDSSGASSIFANSPEVKARALEYVLLGLPAALGTTQFQDVTDSWGLAQAQAYLNDKLARKRKADEQAINYGPKGSQVPLLDPSKLEGADVIKKNRDLLSSKSVQTYLRGYKNIEDIPIDKLRERYEQSGPKLRSSNTIAGGSYSFENKEQEAYHNELKKIIDAIELMKSTPDFNNYQGKDVLEKYNNVLNAEQDKLVSKSYVYPIDLTENEGVLKLLDSWISVGHNSTAVQELDSDYKVKTKWASEKPQEVDKNKLKKAFADSKHTNIYYSPAVQGYIINYLDADDEDAKEANYFIPTSILSQDAQRAINTYLEGTDEIAGINDLIQDGSPEALSLANRYNRNITDVLVGALYNLRKVPSTSSSKL